MPFFLDANSDKYVMFEIIALIRKKPLKSNGKLRKKPYIQLVKKPPKLNKKTKKKLRDLINKKLPKLYEETRKKIDHLCFVYCFVKGEKPLKLH